VASARPEVREVLPLLAALASRGLSQPSAVECAAAPATPAHRGSLAAPSTPGKSLLRADAEEFVPSNKRKQLEGAEMLAPKRCLQHGCGEVDFDDFCVERAASDVLVVGAASEARAPSVTVHEVPGGGDCPGARCASQVCGDGCSSAGEAEVACDSGERLTEGAVAHAPRPPTIAMENRGLGEPRAGGEVPPSVPDSSCDGLLDGMVAATALSLRRCADSAFGARRDLLALPSKRGKMVACRCGKVLGRTRSDGLCVCDACAGDIAKSTSRVPSWAHGCSACGIDVCTPCLDWVADAAFAGLEVT
jgi:hypothetical protein